VANGGRSALPVRGAELGPSTRGLADCRARRTHSVFTYFTPDELETGFSRLEQAVTTDPGALAPAAPALLLTLERRGLLDVGE